MRIWAFPSFYPYDHPGHEWSGIFAHRQYKGLIESGAELKVVVPVLWHPGGPLSGLHPDWKESGKLNYPVQRVYDGITVYHPRIENRKPSRLFRKPYADRYIDAIIGFFKNNHIKLDPAKDIFYSQWLPDAGLVQIAAKRLGIRSGVLAIGDDVLILPQTAQGRFDFFKRTLHEADARFFVATYLGDAANKITGTSSTMNPSISTNN